MGLRSTCLSRLTSRGCITGAFALTVTFNVVANLVLIPMMGINGAALTTVFSGLGSSVRSCCG